LAVLELLEEGELQKLHKKWWIDKGECVADDTKVPCILGVLSVMAIARTYAYAKVEYVK